MSGDLKRLLALLAFTALIFSNSLGNSFVWEDRPLILENPRLKDLSFSYNFFSPSYWESNYPLQPRYRPIRLLTFSIDYKLWGFEPFGYHLTNLLLHAANVALLYLLGLALFKSRFAALSSAFFFAAHPAHVEAVTYVKNRTELLSMLFYLLAALLYLKTLAGSAAGDVSGGKLRRGLLLAVSLASFAAALLSKEMAISLPLALAFWVALFNGQSFRARARNALTVLPFFVVGALLLKLMVDIAQTEGLRHAQLPDMGLSAHIGVVLKTYLYYFKTLLLPTNLNAEATFLYPGGFLRFGLIAPLAGLVAATFVVSALIEKRRMVAFALFWTAVALLPVANIEIIAGRPLAEQRAYIPSAGFAFLLGLVICDVRRRWRPGKWGLITKSGAVIAAVAITISYSAITVKRNAVWKDDFTLWTDTLAKSPRLGRVHHNMADAYKEKGLIKDAMREYGISLAIDPLYDRSHYNLGNLYKGLGSLDKAIAQYKTALGIEPLSAKVRNNLGTIYASMGRIDSAIEQFKRALEIDPYIEEARTNLAVAYREKERADLAAGPRNTKGVLLFKAGFRDKAGLQFLSAAGLDPSSADPRYNLGFLMAGLGRWDRAALEYFSAIGIDGSYHDAYLNLGNLFQRNGLGRAAQRIYLEGLARYPASANLHKAAGLMYLNLLNEPEEAARHFALSVEIAPDQPEAERLRAVVRRLKSQTSLGD